jgi:SAM-dependent methyltransferase
MSGPDPLPSYETLAGVYDWLVPDALLTPEGNAAAFAGVIDDLPAGSGVLDCAAGTGRLAIGLARRGFGVAATDASPAMVARTRDLAGHHGAGLDARVCTWARLAGWERAFAAVFCVGNSLAHASGTAARRAALVAMAGVLEAGGRLVLTSRNWERLRARRPGLELADRLTEREGGVGLVVRAWSIPGSWEAPHHVEVAVAVLGRAGGVRTVSERLTFWPFTRAALDDDLRAAGLEPESSTYDPAAERYLVTARRALR